MRVGSIVIRCYEFDRMLAFWQEALHYVPRAPAECGWVVLQDPLGRGPNISLDQYPERRKGKRADFTWTSIRVIWKMKLDAYFRWEPSGIHGDTDPGMTSLCWPILMTISSASCKEKLRTLIGSVQVVR